jgi:hypothetical protein
MHDNDSAVDAYVEVAQRPPQQALFGRRLMEWALHSHPDEPFLHLGDVMDLSCRIEAERMSRIFVKRHSPGAILPGNHDGLMFGIYAYSLLGGAYKADSSRSNAVRWNRACRRGAGELDDGRHKSDGEAFTKRDFIALYITEHSNVRPEKPGLVPPPPDTGRHSVSWRRPDPEASCPGSKPSCSTARHAESYLAQRLKLPRAPGATRDTIIIGLDTNQAGPLVDAWDALLGRSPGDRGHVHSDQVEAVSKWVDEAIARGDVVVFAGHHNWRSLSLSSRASLRQPDAPGRAPAGVSLGAHAHRLLGSPSGARQPADPGAQRQLAVRLAAGLSPHQLCL